MRTTNSSAIDARLDGLVHESARGDPGEREHHLRFMIARMTAGALALALIPPFLLWRGAPSPAEHVALAAMAAPLLAAAVLARTGLLALAQIVVSAALAASAIGVAAVSEGFGPAIALVLLALPAEALLSGSRRAAVVAGFLAAAGLLAVAGLHGVSLDLGPTPWLIAPALALVAVGHLAAAVLASLRGRALQPTRGAAAAGEASCLGVIDDLVTWHDRNGHVLEASAASLKLLDLPPAALGGRGLVSRVHVSDRPAFLRAVSEAARSDRTIVAQFRLHAGPEPAREGGEALRVIWVEMRAHRMAAGADPACAVVAVTRDVSEHKREAEELDGARRLAERADLAKGRFLAAVSHELRTPLNAIIGFSDILAAEGAGAAGKRRDYAGIVRDSGRHLLAVADTLLDLSKIETGDFPIVPEPFDVADLVRGCGDLLSLNAEEAGIALARTVAPDLPEIVADPRACRQILLNLLSNALKFTPRGGEIRVEAVRHRDRIVLTVSDTGVGVTAADLPRLGDPFFQVSDGSGRPREGTGLGLSVVRGLVGLHGGTMTIESAPGEGTRVSVSLPIDSRTGALRASGTASVSTLSRSRERGPAKVGSFRG